MSWEREDLFNAGGHRSTICLKHSFNPAQSLMCKVSKVGKGGLPPLDFSEQQAGVNHPS